jgi:glucose-1-phosphate thymidylyltransferase
LLKEVDNPKMFGVAHVKGDKVLKLEEKPDNPRSNLALVGVYLFNKKIHEAINAIKPSKRGELEITEAIQYLLDNSYNVQHYILKDWWLDTGKKDDLLIANRIVLDEYINYQIKGSVDAASNIEGRVQIGKNSKIVNSIIRGPAIVGENCNIANSYVGPYTSISDNVNINNSEVEYSVLMNNSSITNIKKRIAESLIGSEVKIECTKGTPNIHKFLIGDHSDIILNES